MTDDDKYVHLQLRTGPGWVPLPLDEDVDPDDWARADVQAAAAGVEPTQGSIGEEAAAGMLADALRDARESHPDGIAHVACAFQPDPIGPVLVVAHCLVLPFDEDGPVTVNALLDDLGASEPSVGEADRRQVTLPIGPAVRLRRMVEEPDEPGGTTGRVVEGCTYVVLPEGLPGFVYLNALWSAVTIGDELAALVDELAVRIELDFRQ